MPATIPQRDPASGKFLPTSDTPPPADQGAAAPPPPPEPPKVTNPMQRLAENFLQVPDADRQPEKKKEDAPAKPAKPAAPAKPKRAVPPPAPALTAEQMAAAVAEGTARAIAAKPKQDEPPKPESDGELSAEDKKRLPVLERLEKLMPEQYKGISKKYKDSRKAEEKYIAEWKAANPGQEFDGDSDVHDAFYEKNEIEWQDEDYMEAQADIRAEAKIEERMRPVQGKLTEFDRMQKLQAEAPKIGEEQNFHAREFWKHMGKDYEGLVTEKGLDMAKWAELEKADPVLHGIRAQAAIALNIETQEMYKLMNGLATYDEANPVHVNLTEFATRIEAELASKPADEQRDAEGRQFLPAEKYYKLPKAQRESLYWTPSMRDLMAVRSAELAGNAAKMIAAEEKKLETWAKARGLAKNGAATETQQPPPPPPAEPTETEDGKPISPSADDQTRLAAVRGRETEKPSDALSARLATSFLS